MKNALLFIEIWQGTVGVSPNRFYMIWFVTKSNIAEKFYSYGFSFLCILSLTLISDPYP